MSLLLNKYIPKLINNKIIVLIFIIGSYKIFPTIINKVTEESRYAGHNMESSKNNPNFPYKEINIKKNNIPFV